jgi:RNA polymerase sigma-70 factor (ECF subfamily)
MVRMNDWRLLCAYARGDDRAFASLVEKYFPLVYSAAVRQVGHGPLAHEVAQAVFIIFARQAALLPADVLLTGWFLRTALFVAKNALQSTYPGARKEGGTMVLGERNTREESDEPGAESLMDEAIFSLSKKEQQCVLAHFFEGRSFREIAQQQHISEEVAQKRVARALEKIRAFLERRGHKVSVAFIRSTFGVKSAPAAHAQLVQAALVAVQAALEGKTEPSASRLLAERVMRALAWRRFAVVGLPLLLSLLALGGSFLLLRDKMMPAPARAPPFPAADNRIERLAKDWSQVVQRAAFLMRFPQGGPPLGDANRAAYERAVALVRSETLRISSELHRVLGEGREHEQFAQFLTIELREVLGLDAVQEADVFAQLHWELSQGATFKDGVASLGSAKVAFGVTLRQRLSLEQQQRFDQTYGADASGVLAMGGLILGIGK